MARLNRKLALARRTIAELIEVQQAVEAAEARAEIDGEAVRVDGLDTDQLRVELRRARSALARLESESTMKNDVISALEGDAVLLQEVKRDLQEQQTMNDFLKQELAEVMDEVRSLRRGSDDETRREEGDQDADSSPLGRALARGSGGD